MAFTEEVRSALSAKLSEKHVRVRHLSGVTLSYIEGWHAIAEANRIFGYEAWDRETIRTGAGLCLERRLLISRRTYCELRAVHAQGCKHDQDCAGEMYPLVVDPSEDQESHARDDKNKVHNVE